jgi:hypothetical protein
MDVVAPTEDGIVVLRAIARAGFGYQSTKALGEAAGWKLVDDELDLGYVAFEMPLGMDGGYASRLAVEVVESGRRPRAFVPLLYFEDYKNQRQPFDEAFRSLSEQLSGILGPPSFCGGYDYRHRKNWSYAYSWWSFSDATLVLVQDEFDIQFGMDVTLWVLPAGAPVEVPVSGT